MLSIATLWVGHITHVRAERARVCVRTAATTKDLFGAMSRSSLREAITPKDRTPKPARTTRTPSGTRPKLIAEQSFSKRVAILQLQMFNKSTNVADKVLAISQVSPLVAHTSLHKDDVPSHLSVTQLT
jgi:hypothetical protein